MRKNTTVSLKEEVDGQLLVIPEDFKLDGDSVKISRRGDALLLTPRYMDWSRLRAVLAEHADPPLDLVDDAPPAT